MQALNGLQTNASILEQIRKAGNSLNKFAIPEMREWCARIGLTVCLLNSVNDSV